jgi:hypothetical protein
MTAGNIPPPGSQQSAPAGGATYVMNAETSAQKRQDANMGPPRDTAPVVVNRPPDADAPGCAQWLLVTCAALLALAIVMLLLGRFLQPNRTLASIFNLPTAPAASTAANTAANNAANTAAAAAGEIAANLPSNLGGNLAAGVNAGLAALPQAAANLPDLRLWLTDDFTAAGAVAPPQSIPGRLNAAVLADAATGLSVYRMQVEPNQMGWTLFDLAGAGASRLDTSATVVAPVAAGAPAGAPAAAGVIARFNGPGSFYLLTVDGSGTAKVEQWLGGQPSTLQTAVGAINPAGAANQLAVEDDGRRLRFYVNGALMLDLAEPAIIGGRPGIAALTPGPDPATVDFDWIAIYRPS